MLVQLYRSNQPAVLLTVPLLVAALFARSLFAPPVDPGPVMPLQGLVEMALAGTGWARGALGMLLITAIAVQLAMLVNGTGAVPIGLMERHNHLPALLFPLLLAAMGPEVPLGPALTGMPLAIMALRRGLSIADPSSGGLGALFGAGLLTGTAALFHLPHVLLLLAVWVSVAMMRPFRWREYVVPLVGVALPFYLAWAAIVLVDGGPWRPLSTVVSGASILPGPMEAQRSLLWILLGLMALPSVLAFAGAHRRGVVREKNLRSSFIAFMLVQGGMIVLLRTLGAGFQPVLAAVPLAVFLGHGLQGTQRRWLTGSAVYALLALALWAQWGG